MYIRVYHVAITSLEYIVLNLYFLAFSSKKIYINIIYIKGKTNVINVIKRNYIFLYHLTQLSQKGNRNS